MESLKYCHRGRGRTTLAFGIRWGSFPFSAGTNDFVRLRTDGTTGYVFGDAFRFVK